MGKGGKWGGGGGGRYSDFYGGSIKVSQGSDTLIEKRIFFFVLEMRVGEEDVSNYEKVC